MAPTRGFRRAIVAIAVTIIAARFSVRLLQLRQRAAPKPAPVRTPTVRPKLDAVLSEWSDIYGASPPPDSRLLAHYMTTPPEAPPVKLRRKAGYDAGSAFKRWARRRGKGE